MLIINLIKFELLRNIGDLAGSGSLKAEIFVKMLAPSPIKTHFPVKQYPYPASKHLPKLNVSNDLGD
jgi:hypothetical protein